MHFGLALEFQRLVALGVAAAEQRSCAIRTAAVRAIFESDHGGAQNTDRLLRDAAASAGASPSRTSRDIDRHTVEGFRAFHQRL
jgi:hypothetical protein